MPLIPAYFDKLKELNAMNSPPLRKVPVDLIRETFRTMQPERSEVKVAEVKDMLISTNSHQVPVRLYLPSKGTKMPVVLMYHGGGWVIGDLTTVDGQCRHVCAGTGAMVVAVDYRLAPEHRFPTAAEDCYAVLSWASESIGEFGGDASRIAVAGDSAGGNLAAVVAQLSRDREGPPIVCQLLVYPVIDGTNFDTRSYVENAIGFGLSRDDMMWFWDQYTDKADRANPYASPIHADTLKNLPPALVMTAEYDVLRDEGEAYGERLKEEGVDAEVIRYDGFIHGFFGETDVIPDTRRAMNQACYMLNRHLWN